MPERRVALLAEGELELGARRPRGSDLHKPLNIRRLTRWAQPRLKPSLTVVLVDGDGQRGRYSELNDACDAFAVVGVAVPEFEAWLLADHSALIEVLGPLKQPRKTFKPQAAKELFRRVVRSAGIDERTARAQLAQRYDPKVVAERSKSFQRFHADLRRAL